MRLDRPGPIRVSSASMVKAAAVAKKRRGAGAPRCTDNWRRGVEKRLAKLEKSSASAPDISLGDVLRAYMPRGATRAGGIPQLAKDIKRHSDTLYDFEKGRNCRQQFPAEVAARVAQAFEKKSLKPLGVKPTQTWLREAWFRVPLAE